jgi:hypothetical protein
MLQRIGDYWFESCLPGHAQALARRLACFGEFAKRDPIDSAVDVTLGDAGCVLSAPMDLERFANGAQRPLGMAVGKLQLGRIAQHDSGSRLVPERLGGRQRLREELAPPRLHRRDSAPCTPAC